VNYSNGGQQKQLEAVTMPGQILETMKPKNLQNLNYVLHKKREIGTNNYAVPNGSERKVRRYQASPEAHYLEASKFSLHVRNNAGDF